MGAVVLLKVAIGSVDGAVAQTDLFGAGGPAVTPTSTPPQTVAPTGPPPGADIKGPLNFLIVGVDTRDLRPAGSHTPTRL